ncbi:MAG: N-6 DNA methylase [Prevotellaceae bacterium]|jgi:hypothetical protein|nr:N-6 DNA methylase [Prevotellaceae bacterium]
MIINHLIERYFSLLNFDFKQDLKSDNLLSRKEEFLKGNVFFYDNKNQTDASFYLITITPSEENLEKIRKSIWNENSASSFFYPTDETHLRLCYAKGNPKEDLIEFDTFDVTKEEATYFEKIKKWQFDSGAFWLSYADFLKKAKTKTIDKELVETLKILRKELQKLIHKEDIVQAWIDRTLYAKFLDDNHIINSVFYKHYFGDSDLDYKQLLQEGNPSKLNKLFKIIHEIFNNNLFDDPKIEDKYLTKEVCNLIYTSLSADLKTKQLRLFDFQFNVLPIELISYIYEAFLSKEQKANGIYYTPRKLAQLIVDDVITEKGKVLDPACGSGMFLVTAFQKLLKISEEDKKWSAAKKIQHRTEILSKYIFGIEKFPIAQRFAIFSLSLQIFKDIDPIEIRNYIAEQLQQNKEIDLFNQYSFFDNIKCANSLSIKDDKPFNNENFDFIVGNPPFFKIKDETVFSEEIAFLNKYEVKLDNKTTTKAKNIVGQYQISQCFFLKIKDWSKQNTRFGFVSNNSNFYNNFFCDFQQYFYSNYNIEKIYELSRVKDILFEKAKEGVVSVVFTNNTQSNNKIAYYPVDMGLFSEKPFNLLIIQEDSVIEILQQTLTKDGLRLRDYYIGNEYDLEIINTISKECIPLNEYVSSCAVGIGIIRNDVIAKHNNANGKELHNEEEQAKMKSNFMQHFFSESQTGIFSTPCVDYNDIFPFSYYSKKYLNPNDIIEKKYRRNKDIGFFEGNKLLCRRIVKKINGKYFIPAVFDKKTTVYTDDIYVLRLKDNNLYPLFTAIINSYFIGYILNIALANRFNSSWAKLDKNALLSIPIPKELNEDLVAEISEISQDLTEGKYEYSEKIARKLNGLIFDLYDLSYIEKQRIRDYFLPEKKTSPKQTELEVYKQTLTDVVSMYLKNPELFDVEFSPTSFDLIAAKISLNKNKLENPNANKVAKFFLNEIFEQNPSDNVLLQEKIFDKDCVYIIRKNVNKNWTETKAFEDGHEILKRLMAK